MQRNPAVPGQQTHFKRRDGKLVARRAQSYNKRILSCHYNQQSFEKSRLCNRYELPTVTEQITAVALMTRLFHIRATIQTATIQPRGQAHSQPFSIANPLII